MKTKIKNSPLVCSDFCFFLVVFVGFLLLMALMLGCSRPIPKDANFLGDFRLNAAAIIDGGGRRGWQLSFAPAEDSSASKLLPKGLEILVFTAFGHPMPDGYEIGVPYKIYEKNGTYWVVKATQ